MNRITADEVTLECKDPVDPTALEQAKAIIAEIKADDDVSGAIDPFKLLTVAKRFGDLQDAAATTFVVSKEECELAYNSLSEQERTTLNNLHRRVQKFAIAQRHSIVNVEVDIPGGKAGHTVSPCKVAGCYAPGGRYPLPSSVLMTAVTARAAGCDTVVLSSPNPAPITMAAAHVSGVDLFLGVGGAQAIATMAYGTNAIHIPVVPKCDVIVGPGNKWVTAAKSIVNGYCGIDMLAGPSEVLVICDDTCSPEVVAADLLAQAEHDVVARAIVLCTCDQTLQDIDNFVKQQLADLPEPNRSTATEAITKHSFAVLCQSVDEMITISDKIAPEHLEIQTRDSQSVADKAANYGGLFIGQGAAEVLGDYGAGPNHTLPTGGTGRYTGGLSVFDFLRIRTYMRMDDSSSAEAQGMVQDSITMARLEGLEAHARAAEQRLETKK
jgi:histidinol dehydrogenase